MRMLATALILFFAQVLLAAQSAYECRKFFLYPDGTTQLLAYIETIPQSPLIQGELNSFYQKLMQSDLQNPISARTARVNAELQIHRKGLQSILDHHYFDLSKLAAWAESKVLQKNRDQQERTVVDEKTKDVTRVLTLIPPFELPGHGYSIQIMDSPVTQEMWLEHFDANPQTEMNPARGIPVSVRGKSVLISPGHPVRYMTYWSALVFANEVSKKMGLPEAYDLKNLEFEDVNSHEDLIRLAGEGKLKIKEEMLLLEGFAWQNKKEDIVRRPGMRLPTPEEFETILHKLAHLGGEPFNNSNPTHIAELTSAGNAPHPIGSARGSLRIGPYVIDDLVGNACFWSHSFSAGKKDERIYQNAMEVGRDYLFSTINPDVFSARSPSYIMPSARAATGVILVRTVPP